MSKKNSEEEVDESRTYPINSYLKTTKLSDPLKAMMRTLYKGESHSMSEWKIIDEKVNQRRCN